MVVFVFDLDRRIEVLNICGFIGDQVGMFEGMEIVQ